jgi:Icc-related predicted phosphoesterase
MKILATSDIHGNKALIYLIHSIARKENADALIIAGDIAPKAFYQLFKKGSKFDISSGFRLKNREDILQADEQQIKAKLDLLGFVEIPQDAYNLSTTSLKQKEKLSEMCELLKTIGVPVYMLIGNDDHIPDEDWDKLLADNGIINLNLRSHVLGEFKIVGFHYVLPTPWNTNNELPEDELAKKLKHIEKQVGRRTILVTHGSPKGVLDRLANGLCVGSESIFKLTKDKQPAFHIFGHIHEAFGNTKIGDTICCNASCLWNDWLLRGFIIDTQTMCIEEIEKAISLDDFRRICDKHLPNTSRYLAESEVTDG